MQFIVTNNQPTHANQPTLYQFLCHPYGQTHRTYQANQTTNIIDKQSNPKNVKRSR